MNSLLLLAAITSAACSVSKYEDAAFTASAHLEEEAELNRTQESDIGAYLVLWNKAACEKLNSNEDGLPDDEREKFENLCTRIAHFERASEAEYVTASQALINGSSADFVTLVWAEKSGLFGKTRHVVVLADSSGASRLKFPGYGREGKIDQACEPSPWSFPSPPGA